MKVTVVYTMNGCPHCTHIKEELTKNNILFIERDIDDFEDEYEEFTKITNNEYVPALMLLTIGENDETSNVKFIPNTTIDWQDYFSDMIGVSKPIDGKLEEIVLHFNQLTGKYMENKPIHETQKHKWLNEETLEIKIKVIPNYELERLILSYGDSVKVMEPKDLRQRIKNRVENNVKLYG